MEKKVPKFYCVWLIMLQQTGVKTAIPYLQFIENGLLNSSKVSLDEIMFNW